MVGLQRSSRTLPKATLAPKQDHGNLLMVCCPSDPLQLSESQRNCYPWEVCSANQWDALKIAMPSSWHWSTEWAQFFSRTMPDHMSHRCSVLWKNRAMKIFFIHHIHLSPRQPTTTSSGVSTTFCRKNAFTTRWMQKTLSKNSLNPETWIYILQE